MNQVGIGDWQRRCRQAGALGALLLVVFTIACSGGEGGSAGNRTTRQHLDEDDPFTYSPPAEPDYASIFAQNVVGAEASTGEVAGTIPSSSEVTSDGAFSHTIPLRVPEGVNGLTPELALTYNSRAGDGPLGVGWGLSGFSRIERCRQVHAVEERAEGVLFENGTYGDSYCLDGVKLMPTQGTPGADGSEYRAEVADYARVVSHGDYQGGPDYFRVWDKDGRIRDYTRVREYRRKRTNGYGDLGGETIVSLQWHLTRVADRAGNEILVEYGTNTDWFEPQPSRISYANGTRSIVFSYDFSHLVPGLTKRCVSGVCPGGDPLLTHILINTDDEGAVGEQWRYTFSYEDSPSTFRRRLTRLEWCEPGVDVPCLSKRFTWDSPLEVSAPQRRFSPFWQSEPLTIYPGNGEWIRTLLADFNGDGRDDLLYTVAHPDDPPGPACQPRSNNPRVAVYVRLSQGLGDAFGPTPFGAPIDVSHVLQPSGGNQLFDAHRFRLADFNGDGAPELFAFNFDGFGPTFGRHVLFEWNAATQDFHNPIGGPFYENEFFEQLELGDADGDGRSDAFVWSEGDNTTSLERGWHLLQNRGTPAATAAQEPRRLTGTGFCGASNARAVVDLTGDGRFELVGTCAPGGQPDGPPDGYVRTAGLSRAGQSEAPYRAHPGVGDPDPRDDPLIGDVNGDGLDDLIRVGESTVDVSLNTGLGFTRPYEALSVDIPGGALSWGWGGVPDEVRVADFNGDGRADLLFLEPFGWDVPGCDTRVASGRPLVALSDGRNYRLAADPGVSFVGSPTDSEPRWAHDSSLFPTRGFSGTTIGDVDGNGIPEIVMLEGEPGGDKVLRLYALSHSGNPNFPGTPVEHGGDLLVQVQDGDLSRSQERIDYATLSRTENSVYTPGEDCPYPQRCLKRGVTVVERYRVGFFESDRRSWAYSYEDGRMDVGGRGFLGFRCVQRIDEQTGQVEKTCFDPERRMQKACPGYIYPYAHKPIMSEVRTPIDADLSRVRVEHTDYDWRDPRWMNHAVYAVELDKKIVTVSEGSPTSTDLVNAASVLTAADVQLISETTYQIDSMGNLEQEHEVRSGNGEQITTRHFRRYDNHTDSRWLIGIMHREEVERQRQGEPMQKRIVEYGHDARGLLERVTVEPGGGDDVWNEQVFPRDSRGLVTQVTDRARNRADRTTIIGYDPAGVHVRRIENAKGHVSYVGIHPALGTPMVLVDANGAVSQRRFDRFGRLRFVDEPHGGDTEIEIGGRQLANERYGVSVGLSLTDLSQVVRSQTVGGGDELAVFDGFGRLRSSYWKLPHSTSGVDQTFDRYGNLSTRSLPHDANDAAPGHTAFEYDLIGRPTLVTNPDGSDKHFWYPSYYQEDSTDEESSFTRQIKTIDGLLAQLGKLHRGRMVTTEYRYHSFGELRSVTTPLGSTIQFEVDHLGRRTKVVDPDAGVRRLWYDGFGDPREEWHGGRASDNDNLLYKTTYGFDVLGRPLSTTTQCTDLQHCRNESRSFVWDDAPHAAGSLVRAEAYPDDVATSFSYDALGRLKAKTLEIDGEAHTLDLAYDSRGRAERITYPAVDGRSRFYVDHRYVQHGYMDALRGDGSGTFFWHAVDLAPDGTVTSEMQEFAGAHRVWREFAFDPLTRRLRQADSIRSATDSSSGEVQQRFTYDYLDNGLLQARNEFGGGYSPASSPASAGVSELFDYDRMNRLTHWRRETAGAVDFHRYDFDDDGNLTWSLRTRGGSTDEETYGYGANGAGPHAATSVADLTYAYDKGGRMTRRSRAGSSDLALKYTSFDLPFHAERAQQDGTVLTTDFRYDAFGTRVAKSSELGTTVYMDGLYEKRTLPAADGGDASVQHAFYVRHGERLVAQVTYDEATGTNERVYVHGDPLGSTSTLLGEDGTLQQSLYFDPWGQRIDATGSVLESNPAYPVTLGFTGHEHDDELGLINMNGRLYDPRLRRVLTPDPLVSAPTADGWNPYAYALNSPTAFVDPSGYSAIPGPGASSGCGVEGPCFEVGDPQPGPDRASAGSSGNNSGGAADTASGNAEAASGASDGPEVAEAAATEYQPEVSDGNRTRQAGVGSTAARPGVSTGADSRGAAEAAKSAAASSAAAAQSWPGTHGGMGTGMTGGSFHFLLSEPNFQFVDTSETLNTGMAVATAFSPGSGVGAVILGAVGRFLRFAGLIKFGGGTARGVRSLGAAAKGDAFRLIAGTRGLSHSFSRHAAQWFGREVSSATHLGKWEALITRAAGSGKQFVSSVGGDATVAHLARIDGKNFVVHFYQGGPRAGELATAFIPNQSQLSAYLRVIR